MFLDMRFLHKIPFSKSFAAALTLVPSQSFACLVCDPEIVLTPPLAACFLDRVDAEIDAMKASGLSYHMVVLGSCEDATGARTRGTDDSADSSRELFSWKQVRNSTPSTSGDPSQAFIIDEAGMHCLAEFLKDNPAAIDPALAFRPSDMCDG